MTAQRVAPVTVRYPRTRQGRPVTVRLPEWIIDAVDERATAAGVTRPEWIRATLTATLEQ